MRICSFKLFAVVVVLTFVLSDTEARNRVRHVPLHLSGFPSLFSSLSSPREKREIITSLKNKNGLQVSSTTHDKANSFIDEIPLPSSDDKDEPADNFDTDFDLNDDYEIQDDDYQEVEGTEYEGNNKRSADLSLESTFWPFFGNYYPTGGYRRYLRRRGWWPAGAANNRWG